MLRQPSATMSPEAADIIQRVLNLTRHPLFTEQKELPAWQEAIDALRELLDNDTEIA